MSISKEDELKSIHKQLLMLKIIEAPGTIVFGLGLYGYFVTEGNAFINILNNKDVVSAMILIGAAIMGICGFKMIPLLKRKAALAKEQ